MWFAAFNIYCWAFAMLAGALGAGYLPLVYRFEEEKLKKIILFGAGLLVGTALAVIIPEGVRSMISEQPVPTHAHNESANSQDSSDPLSVIGVSLVVGFIFMLVVDQITQSKNENLSPSERNITTTVGLVVHAAADGVALGAAATTSHAEVEIIVFLAIMLHKAPAAFGLVTVLIHEGIERNRIRKHLLIFSLAAPVLTLLTYFGIGQKQKETLTSFNATGIAMLFSAGTFLYVATVHVLADLTQNFQKGQYTKVPQNLEEGKTQTHSAALRPKELVCLVVGCLCPLLLTLGHHH
ncbi:zinc transporter ZIP9 isoform X1 [Euwallacea fornicatus]|uniref:zinc transporter ZIP9 isoform X1 n=1 Tax=Euwallacea fornicatus TaxID=995702 RepID=UPI00338E95FA